MVDNRQRADQNYNVIEDILSKAREEVENMEDINILISGKTGVGKSTLVNSVFRDKLADTGLGKPVTQHLRRIEKENIPLVLYDTRGLELDPAIQAQVKKEITDLYEKTKGTSDQLDLCYYCISAGSSRIEPMEIELIQDIAKKMPVIVVLTMSIGQPAKDFRSYIENLNLPVAAVINVMAKPYKVDENYTIAPYGLKRLIQISLDLIPEDRKRAFTNAQRADIKRKAEEANRWANRYIKAAFGVGFTPIPFSDASLLVPMQVTVIAHITAIFGISIDKAALVSILAAVGGTGGATYLGRTIVANLMKFLPGANMLGGLISGSTAAILTSALARSYIKVLTIIAEREYRDEAGIDDDIGDLMKKFYGEELKKGGLVKKPSSPVDKKRPSMVDRFKGLFKKH